MFSACKKSFGLGLSMRGSQPWKYNGCCCCLKTSKRQAARQLKHSAIRQVCISLTIQQWCVTAWNLSLMYVSTALVPRTFTLVPAWNRCTLIILWWLCWRSDQMRVLLKKGSLVNVTWHGLRFPLLLVYRHRWEIFLYYIGRCWDNHL